MPLVASFSLSNTSSSSIALGEALPGVLQLHQHHAVVLLLVPSPSTSPPPLLDQEGGDVAVPYVC